MFEIYQNINTNEPPGYNQEEWNIRPINKVMRFFKEKEDEEKWRHELKMADNNKNWFQDK